MSSTWQWFRQFHILDFLFGLFTNYISSKFYFHTSNKGLFAQIYGYAEGLELKICWAPISSNSLLSDINLICSINTSTPKQQPGLDVFSLHVCQTTYACRKIMDGHHRTSTVKIKQIINPITTKEYICSWLFDYAGKKFCSLK